MPKEEINRIIAMGAEGIPVKEISKIMNLNSSIVRYHLRKLKASDYGEKTSEVIRLRKAGVSARGISVFLNISQAQVKTIIQRSGLSKPAITVEEVERMVEMAKKGIKTSSIADILGKNVHVIRYQLRKQGLSREVGIYSRPGHRWDLPKRS